MHRSNKQTQKKVQNNSAAGTSMEDVNNNHMQEIADLLAKQNGIVDYDVKIDPGSMKGDNYMGIITSIQIAGKKQDSGKEAQLNVIAKSAVSHEKLREELQVHAIYDREIMMYEEIFKAYERIVKAQEQKDGKQELEQSKTSLPFPKCLYTSNAEGKEVLVLENLKSFGYRVWDRKKPMDAAHVELVMRAYGKLHALSMAFRQREPETFVEISLRMPFIFGDNMDKMAPIMDYNYDHFLAVCRRGDENGGDDVYKEGVRALLKFREEGTKYWLDSMAAVEENFVILHGDCWCNNMLFAYEDASDPTRPTDVKFIDFQVSRVGNPMGDLAYFYYCNTSKLVFDQVDRFQRTYHESLSAQLRALDCDPDVIYSLATFRQQWRKHAKMGFMCAFMLIRVMLSESTEAPDMTKAVDEGKHPFEAFNYEPGEAKEYDRRVMDILRHMVERDYC